MNIEVNCEYKEDLIASVPVAELAAFVLSQEDCPQNAEASVSFIDDDEMTRLNREFRGKTGPTFFRSNATDSTTRWAESAMKSLGCPSSSET